MTREKRRRCWCRVCQKTFLASREDAVTCSAKCRKARNRLLGGKFTTVTDQPDDAADASGGSVTKQEGDR